MYILKIEKEACPRNVEIKSIYTHIDFIIIYNVHIYIYIYIYIFVHVCIYTYIYSYKRTNIYTYDCCVIVIVIVFVTLCKHDTSRVVVSTSYLLLDYFPRMLVVMVLWIPGKNTTVAEFVVATAVLAS